MSQVCGFMQTIRSTPPRRPSQPSPETRTSFGKTRTGPRGPVSIGTVWKNGPLTLAIVSHHFTAMGAVEILPDPTRVIDAFSLSPTALALAIANAAVAVLGMSLAGAFADRRLRQKDAQLTTALNNMAQGLLMFDPQKRLILYNSRYVDMYGLSPHVVKPGCTIEDLLRHHKEVGTLSEDVEQYCATLDAAIAEGKTTSTMESSANGRTIHTVSRPMADGGWVTTHEDVTDRISAQRERDRNRDLLNLIVENVPVTIFVKKASDRRFILVNRACENEWGLSRSEILVQDGLRHLSARRGRRNQRR